MFKMTVFKALGKALGIGALVAGLTIGGKCLYDSGVEQGIALGRNTERSQIAEYLDLKAGHYERAWRHRLPGDEEHEPVRQALRDAGKKISNRGYYQELAGYRFQDHVICENFWEDVFSRYSSEHGSMAMKYDLR